MRSVVLKFSKFHYGKDLDEFSALCEKVLVGQGRVAFIISPSTFFSCLNTKEDKHNIIQNY